MRDGVSNKGDTGDDSNVESGDAASASRHVMADASLGRCSRRKPAAPWRSRPPQAGADDADVDWPLGDTAARLQAGLPDAFDLSAPSTSSSSAPATPVGGRKSQAGARRQSAGGGRRGGSPAAARAGAAPPPGPQFLPGFPGMWPGPDGRVKAASLDGLWQQQLVAQWLASQSPFAPHQQLHQSPPPPPQHQSPPPPPRTTPSPRRQQQQQQQRAQAPSTAASSSSTPPRPRSRPQTPKSTSPGAAPHPRAASGGSSGRRTPGGGGGRQRGQAGAPPPEALILQVPQFAARPAAQPPPQYAAFHPQLQPQPQPAFHHQPPPAHRSHDDEEDCYDEGEEFPEAEDEDEQSGAARLARLSAVTDALREQLAAALLEARGSGVAMEAVLAAFSAASAAYSAAALAGRPPSAPAAPPAAKAAAAVAAAAVAAAAAGGGAALGAVGRPGPPPPPQPQRQPQPPPPLDPAALAGSIVGAAYGAGAGGIFGVGAGVFPPPHHHHHQQPPPPPSQPQPPPDTTRGFQHQGTSPLRVADEKQTQTTPPVSPASPAPGSAAAPQQASLRQFCPPAAASSSSSRDSPLIWEITDDDQLHDPPPPRPPAPASPQQQPAPPPPAPRQGGGGGKAARPAKSLRGIEAIAASLMEQKAAAPSPASGAAAAAGEAASLSLPALLLTSPPAPAPGLLLDLSAPGAAPGPRAARSRGKARPSRSLPPAAPAAAVDLRRRLPEPAGADDAAPVVTSARADSSSATDLPESPQASRGAAEDAPAAPAEADSTSDPATAAAPAEEADVGAVLEGLVSAVVALQLGAEPAADRRLAHAFSRLDVGPPEEERPGPAITAPPPEAASLSPADGSHPPAAPAEAPPTAPEAAADPGGDSPEAAEDGGGGRRQQRAAGVCAAVQTPTRARSPVLGCVCSYGLFHCFAAAAAGVFEVRGWAEKSIGRPPPLLASSLCSPRLAPHSAYRRATPCRSERADAQTQAGGAGLLGRKCGSRGQKPRAHSRSGGHLERAGAAAGKAAGRHLRPVKNPSCTPASISPVFAFFGQSVWMECKGKPHRQCLRRVATPGVAIERGAAILGRGRRAAPIVLLRRPQRSYWRRAMKSLNIKDAAGWDELKPDTSRNSWRKLGPQVMTENEQTEDEQNNDALEIVKDLATLEPNVPASEVEEWINECDKD
ncbi:nascent polypeptide-associated complex subunit alpha, muscle-specific form-like [Schistocerca gregaria]|uniref:nascent polypeptide-associated complex subunit alpha, muscle-specific form-like n=1 Tax=Schistocerca gregaria TaxID=7010 RepID=UPI00211E557C|nr:nascent polypeptide-associated complex subunit alpha, muscle-specific form-like [Schistocerca gregaria]